jgi:hypothetical protein
MNTRRASAWPAAGTAFGSVALVAAAHVASYGLWRGRCLNWGATASEADACLPGDDLLATPDVVTTRAVQIDAPVGAAWPWLVQMGPGRAGAYTYDWIENLLGLNMHSADAIIPEFQHIAVGDAWRLGSRGPVLRIARLEPERALVVRSDDGSWVWAFVLESAAGTARLISRNRIATPGSWLSRALTRYLMEPGSLVMERKMLLGIKARAERLAADGPASAGTGQ